MSISSMIKEARIPQAVLICLLVAVCIILLRNVDGLQSLELSAYDYCLAVKNRNAPLDPRITLIGITEDDIKKQGRWPITDAVLAGLLRKLLSLEPAVIGIDMYRDIEIPPGKRELSAIFSRHPIITVKKIGDDRTPGVGNAHMATNRDLIGASDVLVDPDGVIRRGLLFLDEGEMVCSSFSLLLSLTYLSNKEIYPESDAKNPKYMRLGKVTFIPLRSDDGGYSSIDARGYQYLADFRGGPFRCFTLTEALGNAIPEDYIKGRIVIIGVTADSLKDFFFIPTYKSNAFHSLTYGVELHAMLVSQLLRAATDGERPLGFLEEKYEWSWIFLWALIGTVLGVCTGTLFLLLPSIIGGVALLVGITYYLFTIGVWLPIVAPGSAFLAAGSIVTAYLRYSEKVEKRIIMQLFSRHVSSNVAEMIWKDRSKFMKDGRPISQELMATVLFTDLEGFTAISEKMDPQLLMNWLNEYMNTMEGVITKHNGVINKYIGDAIMVIFGVPAAKAKEGDVRIDAVRAVACALDMGEALRLLNDSWKQRDMHTVRMRVGIYTGPLVAGCLGGARRIEYTVIGDTVNTASRLESYGKEIPKKDFDDIPCRILVGESTQQYTGDRFITELVGMVTLKGKADRIRAYLVTGTKTEEKVNKVSL